MVEISSKLGGQPLAHVAEALKAGWGVRLNNLRNRIDEIWAANQNDLDDFEARSMKARSLASQLANLGPTLDRTIEMEAARIVGVEALRWEGRQKARFPFSAQDTGKDHLSTVGR